MNDLDFFKALPSDSKTKINLHDFTDAAVCYSRVSTQKQALSNHSLETQEKACKRYCIENGLKIIEMFGKTHESAKSDDRKEFQRMLDFIRKNNTNKKAEFKIKQLVVYSIDRFSRAGVETFSIVAELKSLGVKVVCVTSPADTDTSYGQLAQSLGIVMANFENLERRKKSMDGMINMLLDGFWPTKAPRGYDKIDDGIGRYKKIVINSEGKLIKDAFRLKLDGHTNAYIQRWLKLRGLALHPQKLTVIFSNPFYCGIIKHGLLNYVPTLGKQERMITVQEFSIINGLTAKHLKVNKNDNEHLPLKSCLVCDKCGGNLTGYDLPHKNQMYYKCNTSGCKVNFNSKKMHDLFKQHLNTLSINSLYIKPLKVQLGYTFEYQNQSKKKDAQQLMKTITNLKNDLDLIGERFATGKIDQGIHEKYSEKKKKELAESQQEYERANFKLSNLDYFIEISIKMCSNLSLLWEKGPLQVKQRLQNLLFPKGIRFNRELISYRTLEMNSILGLFTSLSAALNKSNNGQISMNTDLSCSVVPTRIELISRV